ncbi:hypothetical protein GIB67_020786 [Kingdonia uniflora]|uniref:Glycosyl hydrolase family 32 N-terminal domain-containing protein n=1 Tax=Kingdonia uniflora TaxID=39325 RepID=A0A7J7M753_9MAGN|nr:hypothetical protein GIB67_020786 [Kingdonia uniflora]
MEKREKTKIKIGLGEIAYNVKSKIYEEEDQTATDSREGREVLLRRMKKSDRTLTGEVVPYNIVPLDAPALTNTIRTFAEEDKLKRFTRGSDGYWLILVGNKMESWGMALLYRSRDFKKWTKAQHPLHSGARSGMWECPDFFPVSLKGKERLNTSAKGSHVKYVLKMSLDLTRFDYYTVGKYSEEKDQYVPNNTSPDNSTGLRYDYGNFYATKTFFDVGKNRRILWGWAKESDHKEKMDSTVQGGIRPFGLLTLGSSKLEEYTAVYFRVFRNKHKPVVLMCNSGPRTTLGKPKQINEILIARRKDARSVKIKRSKDVVKFKVRCSKYLYTLCVFDTEKADKLNQSLPPG